MRQARDIVPSIEGRTGFARFWPMVRGKEDAPVQSKVFGQAPLPEPLRLSLDHVADPRYQNQWIEIYGAVRQARQIPPIAPLIDHRI